MPNISPRGGYGRIGRGGRNGGEVRAHVLAWEFTHGPVPAGLYVLHSCDVRMCVNVAHLFLGTRADNAADMVAKGRQAKGVRNGQSKLSEADISEIRALRGRVLQREIALRFGITQAHVSNVQRGKRWT